METGGCLLPGESVWEQEPKGKAVTRQKNIVWVRKEIKGDLALVSKQELWEAASFVSAEHCQCFDTQTALISRGAFTLWECAVAWAEPGTPSHLQSGVNCLTASFTPSTAQRGCKGTW